MLDRLWSVQNPELIETKIAFKQLEECHLLRNELVKRCKFLGSDEFWDKTLYSINSIYGFGQIILFLSQ